MITGWDAVDAALAEVIATRRSALDRSILVGIAGAQGSGKSTMVPRLVHLLELHGLRALGLALDDFYLTKTERIVLARSIHPLLATRGVPGTHDVALVHGSLDALSRGNAKIQIPCFDKAADDRVAVREVTPPFDVILLEGWCIGAMPQVPAALVEPVNALERNEDADGIWRHWVNDRLAGDYAALFVRLDLQIFLRAPNFAVVERWRGEQEEQLHGDAMDRTQLRRFIDHYERITRATLADHPANLTVDLDEQRRPQLRL